MGVCSFIGVGLRLQLALFFLLFPIDGAGAVIEINREHQIGSHLSNHIHRYRIDDAPIPQKAALPLKRGKDPRNGDTGPHRIRHRACPQLHLLPRDQIGGHTTKRDPGVFDT